MSELAEGPETNVIGDRALGDRGGDRGDALRHLADDLLGTHDADVVVGDEREQAAAAERLAVEHERARLGDRRRHSR